jgi:hypothetical protein
MRSVPIFLAALAMGLSSACEPAPGPDRGTPDRSAVESTERLVSLASLPAAAFAGAEVFVEGPWGEGEDAFARETVAAHTGPMAIAAEPGGGLSVLDTVAGRVHRFDAEGRRLATLPIPVETGDDLVAMPGGGFAVLAYEREPEPHHLVLSFDRRGLSLGSRLAPQAATLPTALVADGPRLLVEQRHAWLLPVDGSPREWGRPSGDLLLRASLTPARAARVTARDREGQLLFETELDASWPVTEVLALEASESLVALVVRHVFESPADPEAPGGQETWLVALDREGAPLGRLELRDSRVTDSGRPVALGPGGDVFELQTTDAGVTVLRYRFQGGRP